MDLIADRGRRVTVEELNTTRLLAHARKQAHQRKLDDMVIVDVDAHHYENEHTTRFLPFMENDVLRQLAHVRRQQAQPRRHHRRSQVGYQDMGGRVTRYPMRGSEKTEARRRAARRPARPSLDGRDERRLFLPVPDRHAQYRPASAEGDGGRPVLGLQPLAHREGAAGSRTAASSRCCACRSPIPSGAAPGRDLRRSQACRRLHGHHRAHHGGARQRLHEDLPRHGGARPGAVVPLRPELGRADVQELQPLHLGACARLLLVQHRCIAPTGWSTAWASASPSCR